MSKKPTLTLLWVIIVGSSAWICKNLYDHFIATPEVVATETREDLVRLQASLGARPSRPPLDAPIDQIAIYRLHIGVSAPADDADAEWVMALISTHPERDVRLGLMQTLTMFYSEGKPGEGQKSGVSQHWKDQATSVIVENLRSPDGEARACAVVAACSGRLWRIAEVRDALLSVPLKEDDLVLKACLQEAGG